jgi:hypothetical protein
MSEPGRAGGIAADRWKELGETLYAERVSGASFGLLSKSLK